ARQVPPRDELELRLARIWEDLLGVSAVGATDDFFALGGHSLLAVRLLARIHTDLGCDLPLAILFDGATVERLAGALRARSVAPRSRVLVPLAAAGRRPPVFFIHPAGGHVFCYLELARRLDTDQPSFGLQFEVPDGAPRREVRVEDLASRYLEEIRRIQPAGPYRLGGWSVGGVIAFEMAQQLAGQGEQVSLLALLDSHAPGGGRWQREGRGESARVRGFFTDLYGMAGIEGEPVPAARPGWRRRAPWDVLLAAARRAGAVPAGIEAAQVRAYFEIFTSVGAAARRYRPRPYRGRAVLFTAGQGHGDPTLGWKGLIAGGLELVRVPGDHYDLLRPSAVEAVARQLTACLGGAEGGALGEPAAQGSNG
ncbi:MAG TPA: thioesterase domain-containing protein, partial [Thermoanaerobaculia bacterium]|nr:thioesterase domain-containing protein [Thermoanaerobaculia bacterium]